MAETPNRPKTCFNCGSEDIAAGVKVKLQNVGEGELVYTVKIPLVLMTRSEPIMAEVCGKCGTITRLYVQNASRNWKKE